MGVSVSYDWGSRNYGSQSVNQCRRQSLRVEVDFVAIIYRQPDILTEGNIQTWFWIGGFEKLPEGYN